MKITDREVPTETVQLKKASLLADTRTKKLGYFGHIIRHSTLQHALLEGKIEGSPGADQERCTWMGNITEWS